MWEQVPMLPLKNDRVFQYDPYGDMFDGIIIPIVVMAIGFLNVLLDPFPAQDIPMLIITMGVPIGVALSCGPGNYGRKNKLKAFGYFFILFSFSTYGSTLFANTPTHFMIWMLALVFLAYLPLIWLPNLIAIAGMAIGLSIQVAHMGNLSNDNASIYIANQRLITFAYFCLISVGIIVIYPQYLAYKKRVALWFCMQALEQTISENKTDRNKALQQYSKHIQRYQDYYKINYKHQKLQNIAEELLQCFLNVTYIINQPLLLQEMLRNKQHLQYCIQNIRKACGEGVVISSPAFETSDYYEVKLLQHHLYNLSIVTNNFIESAKSKG
jgi:hypothetical protein